MSFNEAYSLMSRDVRIRCPITTAVRNGETFVAELVIVNDYALIGGRTVCEVLIPLYIPAQWSLFSSAVREIAMGSRCC